MDKYIAPNFNRREASSSFSEVDAGYIDNAARALKNSGDVVIVEAQHRSLRDHYVKQILARLLTLSPHILVNRCKKDRDWMVAALNQAFVKNKLSDEKSAAGRLNEVWILDLSSSEDFGILKLAHTLVSQFEEAGSSVLVSCSSSLTNLREFQRWSNRVRIPVWHFEVPDSSAINAFLEQEAETGAINEARKLVRELQSADEQKEEEISGSASEIASSISLEDFPVNTRPGNTVSSNGLVIPIKDNSETANLYKMEPIGEESQESVESKIQNEPYRKDRKNEFSWRSIKSAAFGFLIILSAAFAVLFISNNEITSSDYKQYIEGGAGQFFLYLSTIVESDSDDPIAIDEVVDAVVGGSGANYVVANEDDNLIRLEAQDLPPDGNLSRGVEVSLSEVAKLNLRSESDRIRPLLPSAEGAVDRESMEYFAQFGAFENRNSALWYKINRGEDLSAAMIVTKPSGLWAVVTGPFNSRELAKASVEGSEASIYVISASEIIFN